MVLKRLEPAVIRQAAFCLAQQNVLSGAKLRVLGFLFPTDFRLATVGSNPAKYPELFAFLEVRHGC